MPDTQSVEPTEAPANEPSGGLPQLLPMMNLTAAARNGHLQPAVRLPRDDDKVRPDIFDLMARALFRRVNNHVVLTGFRGVGKTAAVHEFARRSVAAGSFPFLSDKRFIWIDCRAVPPEDSRPCLEAIFSVIADAEDVILCLDGLAPLLRSPQGGTNKSALRSILNRPGLQVIGVMSNVEYSDLIGGDAEMMELFTRVEIDEPNEELTAEIAVQCAQRLEQEYGVTIPPPVVQRAVALTSNYIFNECAPAKTVKVLQRACENNAYERSQLAHPAADLTTGDVLRVISELTGIPEATLAGEGGKADFEQALAEAVVGQAKAVQTVSTELRLIKSGLSDPGKPASVMLFAGMTGVGKTELAKRLAELYSSSKRLQTYSMGNFTEPHSVSGIIGVPPGYVGHDQGGRLINDLNADPYSVFLLDEAEKAHPNIWIPFLNLFDEGWIVDQRGVKAHADRAIFILTTNAGGDAIAQMAQSGSSTEEIEERIKHTLSKIRHERSSQPVFTPQFLARLKRIVVFSPLDEPAMQGISRKIVRQMQRLWQTKREKQIVVSDALQERLGNEGHRLNAKSGGKEGGRIIRKLVSDLIEHRIQTEATANPELYRACRQIGVELAATDQPPTEALPPSSICVRFV